ncbi:MAG: DNA primase [Melioribacteraceae bacterium]|nr:DNA primase [Melioribacteraceae bacterium]
MRIPENQIDQIRNSASIVDIISGYIQLKKRGRNFIGLCPFHQEKTPSFVVSDEKQIFRCFGCGAGGNVFKFLMDYKSISFVEAVEEIAEHLGITINYESAPIEQQSELEAYYDLNVFAARFFSDQLLKNDNGEVAREYLKKRNIKPSTQKIFGLGFAPFNRNAFLNHAIENKIDLQKAKQLGLIDSNDKGEYYDKFRGRIIFPIFSPNGRVIAFGGRIFSGEENAAKYLNSPESLVYSKRKTLYGLFHSKEEIRKLDRAILVEGYIDLISLYQAGVKNVVASSGTSLTEEQVQLLSRFTKNIYVLFDADSAGVKAAVRSIEILLKQNFEVKIIALPKGEDPDSFINKNSKEEFEEKISNAINFLEFLTQQYEIQGYFKEAATTSTAIRQIVRILSFLNDELKRNLYIKSIAKKFGLREKLIETELNNFLQNQNTNQKTISSTSRTININSEKLNLKTEDKVDNPFEKEIIRLLFSGNERIITHILDNVDVDNFTNENFKALAMIVEESFNEGKYSPAYIIDKIENDDLKNFILDISLSEHSISKNWDDLSTDGKIEKDTYEYAVETVKNYQIFRIEEEIKRNNKIIEESKDELLHLELLKRNKELNEDRISILNLKLKNEFGWDGD